MGTFALRAEEHEQFRGPVGGVADPVRQPGVELCRLAGTEPQVAVAEDEPNDLTRAGSTFTPPGRRIWPSVL